MKNEMEKEILRHGKPLSLLSIMGVISDAQGIFTPEAIKKSDNEFIYNLFEKKHLNGKEPVFNKTKDVKRFYFIFRGEDIKGENNEKISHTYISGEIPPYLKEAFPKYAISFS
jgi:hypothetical protein